MLMYVEGDCMVQVWPAAAEDFHELWSVTSDESRLNVLRIVLHTPQYCVDGNARLHKTSASISYFGKTKAREHGIRFSAPLDFVVLPLINGDTGVDMLGDTPAGTVLLMSVLVANHVEQGFLDNTSQLEWRGSARLHRSTFNKPF
jgi:hypothetical protein